MARILLVDPDREAIVSVLKAFAGAGLTDVAAVPTASHALTMIERDRPDLIVSRVRVPDIDGFELCSIVRSDPMTQTVRFLLLAAAEDEIPAGADRGGPDRILVALTPPAIVDAANALLDDRADGPRRPALEGPSIGGSLPVMELIDLLQTIAQARRSGVFLFELVAGRGMVLLERGRLVHAEFRDQAGEAGFSALLAATHRETGGTFAFEPLETLPSDAPRTITQPVEQLLLRAAAEINEGRTGGAPITAGTRTR